MQKKQSFTLDKLAQLTESTLVGDPKKMILDVADLESADENDVSFLANSRYVKAMEQSRAGAIFISNDFQDTNGRNFLLSKDPSVAFQKALEALHPESQQLSFFQDIHPTAVIHSTVKLGNHVRVGPYAVIDGYVTIADHSTIGAHSYIGPYTSIGTNCTIHPHVTLREGTLIGDRVILQPGVVLGSCGYGYTQNEKGHHTKLKHIGNVIICDDVEIGANTTIDRSRFKNTQVGKGTKVDNLVQLGHNVQVGEHSLLVAQVGIAGSTQVGNHVILGGKVAVAGHIKIADGVLVAACSGISKNLDQSGKYRGVPAIPMHDYQRWQVQLRNIKKTNTEIKALCDRVATLEESIES